jgi:hypothetical protein
MPYGSVTLIPGVDVEQTPTLLKAGVSVSQLIRYRDGLVQKLGGWTIFYSNVAGTPRELHAWEDLNQINHLGVGTTTMLGVITSGSLQNITPQTFTSDFAPNFSTVASSPIVTIIDPNLTATLTTNDSVYFNVPVSVGGLILSGAYPVTLVQGTTQYQITAAANATTTETNPFATNNTTAAGNATLHFVATPAWVIANMVVFDLTTPASIPASTLVLSTTGSTIVMTNNAAGAGVGSGDNIVICSVPVFTPTSGSATVNVFLAAHGQVVGNTVNFPISTTVGGVAIVGTYSVVSVTDINNFSITVNAQASSSTVVVMNAGKAEIVYYLNIGPAGGGSGFGIGAFGSGGFGTGAATGQMTGTPITATDWTSDNWGQTYLACPMGGGVYAWTPNTGFSTAGLVATAPFFNGGIFVSTQQQILVCWGSTVAQNIGITQDPLLVRWSTIGDYTNFQVLATTEAGSYRLSNGSKIICGLSTPNQNLIITDEDAWAMNYSGLPFVFGFNKIGAGAGAVSSHAVMELRGNVYWMGPSNFYSMTSNGVAVIPCPVWDFVFQRINPLFQQNVRSIPNTPFNEVGWEFPSTSSVSGENDSYVKFNITEQGAPWDCGLLARSAWTDQSILGNPIGAVAGGTIYQHETSNDAAGQPMAVSFTTGYFFLSEGEDFAFIDQILPDFKWGFFGAAQTANIQLSFLVVNYPGDSPTVYGPYTVTQSSPEWLSVRFRGRQMAIQVASSDAGSFWRLGRIRYRYAPSGRR